LRWVTHSGNMMNTRDNVKILYDGDVVNLKDLLVAIFPEGTEEHMTMYSYFIARQGMSFEEVVWEWREYQDKKAKLTYISSLGVSPTYYHDKKSKGWSDWCISRKQTPFREIEKFPTRYILRDDFNDGFCPCKYYEVLGIRATM